ncbi:hypothetical protein TRFO_40057 [Tritrichomonas foetus]|uniref:Uncharacterized protein n=1 Tax=Tritrichomonas foetus TaxID=1144522 RepID=A0A1J4J8G8_9EUKA|nr:hypothetical protein TRFO_40057 [Tritrichomonas foetus]|eukprot:OHS93693.1 hypothetical protein TRFO_40057 [Tritrichomonas foetus]
MENILVSSCLIGAPCRYDGTGCLTDKLQILMKHFNLVSACAECMGGLPTPRTPSERVGNKILAKDGKDVTLEFHRGADRVVEFAKSTKCKFAILKEKSPSCGTQKVYDGSFTGKVVPGQGVLAEKLRANGIECYSDEQIDEVLKIYKKL